jgi:hypothetical protein
LELVEAVRELEYGRPSEPSVAAMLRERRGTCTAKHLYLQQRIAELYPAAAPLIIHRVYRLQPARARELWGDLVATLVPAGGLVDVHRYLTIEAGARRVVVDATFPGGPRWGGHSDMALACGPGEDYPAGEDPDGEKLRLQAEHCEAAIREPFIAALASASARTG